MVRLEDTAAVGSATLLRTPRGVHMNITTEVSGTMYDLPFDTPPGQGVGESWSFGDATTNWFVIFNNWEECTDNACGEDDVAAFLESLDPGPPENPAGVGIHFAAGHVAGSATWNAAGTLKVGDERGLVVGEALAHAYSTEVHIIARSHGPMATIVPGERGDAINSLLGGCLTVPPSGDSTNTCGDAQAAVFPAP